MGQKRAADLWQQIQILAESGDLETALRLAKELLTKQPRNRQILEEMAILFMENHCWTEAEETVAFLKGHFSWQDFWYILQAQLAYYKGQFTDAVRYAAGGLESRNLTDNEKALLYNIVSFSHLELGQVTEAVEYSFASSRLPNNQHCAYDYSNGLFNMHYRLYNQADIFDCIKGYNKFFMHITPYVPKKYCHFKIRIGYISADFCYSVVAFFIYGMLKFYDRHRFEVYVYANCKEDGASQEFAACVDKWRNIIMLSPQEAAAQIHADEIDILFDPSGHTANNCLPVMAYKPAPVQISGIGWFDSTGLSAIDFFLTDKYVDPAGCNDEFFTEKLIRLPHSHFCYMWHGKPTAVGISPFLRNGFITFGSLNKFAKVTDEMLNVWGKIMKDVPHSRLLLKGKTFDSEVARSYAIKRMDKAGIDLKRVVLEGFSDDYLTAYSKIDIALDTFPYPGGGTTCDALYMGVPVVTLVGRNHNSRFGYSLLKNMGLDGLCALNIQEYIDIAVKLANNCDELSELHQKIRRHMLSSPLMDTAMYMTDLEFVYERLMGRKEEYSIQGLKKHEKAGNWEAVIRETSHILAFGCEKESANLAELWGLLGKAYLHTEEYNCDMRAKYALERALSFPEVPQRLELLCFLSEAAEKTDDLLTRYNAAHDAMKLLEDNKSGLSSFWQLNMHNSLANAALALGYYDESENEYLSAIESADILGDKLNSFSSYILASHYKPYTSNEIWKRLQKYNALITNNIQKLPPITRKKSRGEKIRVGYISPDFRQHAMFPIYYGFFACYNKNDFSVIGYHLSKISDQYTELLAELSDEWYTLADTSMEMVAEKIRADEIDILVDLASHSAYTGLPVLAYKPARVQISGWGSLCPTGMDAVDYYVTDKYVDPPGIHDEYFVEKLLYMPTQFPYAGRNELEESIGAPCIKKGYIQLGCFQSYRKINDDMLAAWRKILENLPQARLLLKNMSFTSNSLQKEAYERFRRMGLPMERLELEQGSSDYMERQLDVDIMLDTYPYTGGRTTLDALYMGVPVVTLYGERRNTRFGLSILHAIGLEDLAVTTTEDYINRVVGLGNDWELLDILHRQLRNMMNNSAALSPRIYVQNMENAYRKMAEEHGMYC